MAAFTYRARDEKSGLVTGTIEADTRGSVYVQLDSMGLLPVRVTEVKQTSSLRDLLGALQTVKYDDLIFFTRQLQTIVRSGIPLISGLNALEEQSTNGKIKTALKEITHDIEGGATFSDALSKQGRMFPELYVSMVRAGETGGSLDDVLGRLSELLEFHMKTREMLKQAMRYPTLVVAALVIAFGVLIEFVVPRFAVVFKGAKMELPLPTRMLLFVSDAVQNYGIHILVALVLLAGSAIYYRKTDKGALLFDKVKLKVPIMGPIILKICMSRFANMLENLVKAGVPIIRTLEIVARTVGNRYIEEKLMVISAKVEKGKGITKPMKEAGIFPSLVVHLVSTGEETGSLEQMLKELSLHYNREIDYSVSRLSAWLEPVLTAGLSVMVLFMALAIFLPWWNMMSAMKGGG